MITTTLAVITTYRPSSHRLGNAQWFLLLSLVAAICLAFALSYNSWPSSSGPKYSSDKVLDANFQRAADNALADHHGEGTIVVMDPHTGRIRAIANSKLALEGTFAAGSTIKPFVTLAAMQTGLIDGQFRLSCPGGYSTREFRTSCSHRQDLAALDASEAISYSCNHFFGTIGERINHDAFDSLLADFGFGKVTGAGEGQESAGQVLSAQWRPQSALGEGEHLLVTPIQLITAYTALVNGGHLFEPRVSDLAYESHERRSLIIDRTQRSVIIEGMRGAVTFGSAKNAQLDSLPPYVFGKTGTSTEVKGYRTQGWFIGFASIPKEDDNESLTSPENITLAVLVFLKRAHGAEAAAISRSIFEQLSNADPNASHDVDVSRPTDSSSLVPSARTVKVHLVKENRSLTLPLEDYVARVVAVEGSLENELEALKALAVASRTYTLKNLGRHDSEGYDFCSTTHCQRFLNSPEISKLVRDAVDQTAGETLRGGDGEIVDAYFSASCGGATANINDLWGVTTDPHLVGVKDDYCTTMPHAHWTDVISSADLLRVLQQDPRTDTGKHLSNISVIRRDTSGRAQTIELDGDHRRLISGWEFKIIVGRSLGWEHIKSSRFDVKKSASNYVFVGSGFGHGLGLCQEGAHVMARRGANYREILAKYFPTTSLNEVKSAASSADMIWTQVKPKATTVSADSRRQMASENFRLTYPSTIKRKDAEGLLQVLESNRKELLNRLSSSGLRGSVPVINIFVNDTTGNFVGRTGQPPWAAAATKGNMIELQPLAQLRSRGILQTTVRHEIAHAIVKSLGRGQTPRWLEEGFALYLAGEGPLLLKYGGTAIENIDEIERLLDRARNKEDMRSAYVAAYQAVNRLVLKEGEAAVWHRVIGF